MLETATLVYAAIKFVAFLSILLDYVIPILTWFGEDTVKGIVGGLIASAIYGFLTKRPPEKPEE